MSADQLLGSISTRVNAIEETGIVDVAMYGWGREDLVPFWFGEGDVSTPQFICDAACEALRAGDTFYTDQRGITSLRETIRDYMNRSFGTDLDIDRLTVTNSGMAALALLNQVLLNDGDEVIVIGPVWPNIFSAIRANGGVPVDASIRLTSEGWKLDLEEIFSAAGPKTKAIFINSPSNPTGWMMEADEQRAVMDFARERGIWVIADEVYHQLVFDRPVAPSFLNCSQPDDRLVVVNSFSKSWLMTGWRIGWITHPTGIGSTLAKMVQITTSGVPPFLQHAAMVAMRDGDHVIKDLRERCLKGRDLVYDRLEAWPRVRAVRPKGAFYAFFGVEGMDNSVDYAKQIIDECNVGLAPGNTFGASGEGYLRLCYASEPATLERGMDRLEKMLGSGSRQD